MPVQTLVIWDQRVSRSYIAADLDNAYCILNHSDYEHFMQNRPLSPFSEVYILANPVWDTEAIRWYGYEALAFLLEHHEDLLDSDSDNFALGIFADSEPIDVYNHCKRVNLERLCRYVAAFPPSTLNPREQNLPARRISRSTFSILRRSTIDLSFIIDVLLHKIKYCLSETHDPRGERFDSFKEELDSKKPVFADTSTELTHINQVFEKTRNFTPGRSDENQVFVQEIEGLLQADKRLLAGQANIIHEYGKPLDLFEILVVEDDPLMNSLIAKWLKGFGANVTSFQSGTKTDEHLREYIEQRYERPYDCIFTDLELKIQPDGIFYDYTQGWDVVDLCSKNFPTVPICLLTGGAKDTTSGFSVDKVYKILYKNETNIIPLQTGNEDFISNLRTEITRRKNQYGPNQGWHTTIDKKNPDDKKYREFVKYYYSLTRKDTESYWQYVLKEVTAIKQSLGERQTTSFNMRDGEKNHSPNQELLKSLLVNRLLIIGFALTMSKECKGDFEEIDKFRFSGYCLTRYFRGIRPSLPTPHSWLVQCLGFSIGNAKLINSYSASNLDIVPLYLKSLNAQENFFDKEWELIQEFLDLVDSNEDFFEFLSLKK